MTSSTLKFSTKAFVSAYNDELVIGKCLATLSQTFDVTVFDFGSEDQTANVARTFPVGYEYIGKLSPAEYTRCKNEISQRVPKVFWVDSDEEYPLEELAKVQFLMDTEALFITGFWRFPENPNRLWNRGRIAWTPGRQPLVRAWPREHLDDANLNDWELYAAKWASYETKVWCWHHLFAQRSSLPEDAARASKREQRKSLLSTS